MTDLEIPSPLSDVGTSKIGIFVEIWVWNHLGAFASDPHWQRADVLDELRLLEGDD